MTPDSSDLRASLTEGVWWFGAGSGKRRRASLHFAGGFVRAENEDGERRDARLSEVQISPRIGGAPRKIVFADGVCISADDNDCLDALILKHGGGRKSFALHRLESKWTTALAVIVFAWLFLSVVLVWGVPAFADFAAHRIPRQHVEQLGDELYAQLRRRGLLPAADISPAAAARAERIFARVAAELAEEGDDFRLRLHRLPPNGFALPGGLVIISDALTELLTDDELAAVFAHEIGHIRRRHGVRSALLGSAGGLLAVFGGDITGVSVGVILLNLGYSRAHEREADCFAYDYLRRNGMSGALIGDALEKMARAELPEPPAAPPGSDEDDEYLFRRALAVLSTHPETEERKNLASACGAE